MQPQTVAAEEDSYRALVGEIVRMGKVDRGIVMSTAHVAANGATALLSRMEADGIISKPDHKTSERRVLVTPEDLKQRDRANGATVELDAEARTVLELLEPMLAEREEVSIDGIRTEFDVETETARDVIAELARRHLTGEADDHGTAMVLVTESNGDRPKATRLAPAASPPRPASPPARRPTPTSIRDSIGVRPPALRGDTPPTPRPVTPTPPPISPAHAATPATQSEPLICKWPGCRKNRLQARGLCSSHYPKVYQYWCDLRSREGESTPFPSIEAAVAWWEKRKQAKEGGQASTPTQAIAPPLRVDPPPSPPASPEPHWRTQLAAAERKLRDLEATNRGLETSLRRLEEANRTNEQALSALAEFLERQPTLRRLLHLR